jgi:pimeloyl-ACP methyl ester carboxylesterase
LPDLTGHGSSPPLPPGADLATLGRAVIATARHLGLSPPYALVGHSLGGRVALRAALDQPEAVGEVTLLDIAPGPVRPSSETERTLSRLLAAPAEVGSREEMRAFLGAGGLPGATVEWLLMNLTPQGEGFRWRIDRVALAELRRRTDAEDLWEAVGGRARVRCIRGAQSPYVSDKDAGRLEAAGSQVVTVPGAGHFLHVDRPGEVLAALAASPGPAR